MWYSDSAQKKKTHTPTRKHAHTQQHGLINELFVLQAGENSLGTLMIVFFDTLIWEYFASVFFPTLITYCVVK